jgi:phosphate-selective porin OprO/OprP
LRLLKEKFQGRRVGFSITEKTAIMVLLSKILGLAILFVALFHYSVLAGHVEAASAASEGSDSTIETFLEKAKEGVTAPVSGTHYYWDKGLHIDSRNRKIRLKLGGKLQLDTGRINPDNELETAFSDLEGQDTSLRRLSVDFSGAFFEDWEFKLEMDFSDIRVIRDNWIGLRNIPLIGRFRAGHMKETFSLETQTSAMDLTFMEKALPTAAFSPGRNIGFRVDNAALDGLMTWAVGGFWNTRSFKDVGDTNDRVTNATGANLTGRLIFVPWYLDDGSALLHLGLSYTHGFRGADEVGRFNPLPETTLKSESLVDTGEFINDSVDLINPELAMVAGLLSFQGEYFHVFAGADEVGEPQFWGWYVYLSYFLTSDHRKYKASSGTFSRGCA